jgi:hypothetical protein
MAMSSAAGMAPLRRGTLEWFMILAPGWSSSQWRRTRTIS